MASTTIQQLETAIRGLAKNPVMLAKLWRHTLPISIVKSKVADMNLVQFIEEHQRLGLDPVHSGRVMNVLAQVSVRSFSLDLADPEITALAGSANLKEEVLAVVERRQKLPQALGQKIIPADEVRLPAIPIAAEKPPFADLAKPFNIAGIDIRPLSMQEIIELVAKQRNLDLKAVMLELNNCLERQKKEKPHEAMTMLTAQEEDLRLARLEAAKANLAKVEAALAGARGDKKQTLRVLKVLGHRGYLEVLKSDSILQALLTLETLQIRNLAASLLTSPMFLASHGAVKVLSLLVEKNKDIVPAVVRELGVAPWHMLLSVVDVELGETLLKMIPDQQLEKIVNNAFYLAFYHRQKPTAPAHPFPRPLDEYEKLRYAKEKYGEAMDELRVRFGVIISMLDICLPLKRVEKMIDGLQPYQRRKLLELLQSHAEELSTARLEKIEEILAGLIPYTEDTGAERQELREDYASFCSDRESLIRQIFDEEPYEK